MYNQIVKTVLLIFGLTASGLCVAQSPWDKVTQAHAGVRDITVYRSESCGCCSDWLAHLEVHEFNVTDVKIRDMAGIKKKFDVPQQLASCHTAIIDGYVIEGHVPAEDIKRLLREKPDIAGLSVPQMPRGTPGMEMGDQKDPFAVIQYRKNGEWDSYHQYWDY